MRGTRTVQTQNVYANDCIPQKQGKKRKKTIEEQCGKNWSEVECSSKLAQSRHGCTACKLYPIKLANWKGGGGASKNTVQYSFRFAVLFGSPVWISWPDKVVQQLPRYHDSTCIRVISLLHIKNLTTFYKCICCAAPWSVLPTRNL